MLRLEIVTPEKKVLDAEVDSVTIPTASGEAAILQNHAPLVSALKPGIVAYAVKGTTDKLVISGGFVEVNSNFVSVLADSAEKPEDIDSASAKSDLDAAEKALAAAGMLAAEDASVYRDRLDLASARLRLVAGK
ncbi:MAG: ATP synthase F1 subunit epsilon [Chloracidobacterium sp.]|nr:ATP synthase F1 subunit epsilon [Chloracidobacterium sp.]